MQKRNFYTSHNATDLDERRALLKATISKFYCLKNDASVYLQIVDIHGIRRVVARLGTIGNRRGWNMLTLTKSLSLLFVIGVIIGLSAIDTSAQEQERIKVKERDTVAVTTTFTFRSRWIYRGIDLGSSPQIQPRITLAYGGFNIGIWGSSSLALATDANEPGAAYRETNVFMQYTFDVGKSSLTAYMQNHYNPRDPLGDFSSDGSHFLQAQLMWRGSDDLPIDLLGGWVFYRDPDESLYLEAGYSFRVSGMDMRTFVSGTPDKSGFNGTRKAGITQVGFTITKTLPITDTFQLPVSAQIIVNPYQNTTYGALLITF